jgi:hypothetical protein
LEKQKARTKQQNSPNFHIFFFVSCCFLLAPTGAPLPRQSTNGLILESIYVCVCVCVSVYGRTVVWLRRVVASRTRPCAVKSQRLSHCSLLSFVGTVHGVCSLPIVAWVEGLSNRMPTDALPTDALFFDALQGDDEKVSRHFLTALVAEAHLDPPLPRLCFSTMPRQIRLFPSPLPRRTQRRKITRKRRR